MMRRESGRPIERWSWKRSSICQELNKRSTIRFSWKIIHSFIMVTSWNPILWSDPLMNLIVTNFKMSTYTVLITTNNLIRAWNSIEIRFRPRKENHDMHWNEWQDIIKDYKKSKCIDDNIKIQSNIKFHIDRNLKNEKLWCWNEDP